MSKTRRLILLLFLFVPHHAFAQGPSLFSTALQAAPRAPLIAMAPERVGLLAGREAANIFTFEPTHRVRVLGPSVGGGPVARLRDLIASVEAGPMGYDAVQHGARIRPTKPPTAMTLNEIFAWIKATPGQPHAIGRYQFIPKTLEYLVDLLGVPRASRFSPEVQDKLADALLAQAGIEEFLAGDMARDEFMDGLARIWAGLPTGNGRSHYHGYAGNKATMSRAYFDAEMNRIFGGA